MKMIALLIKKDLKLQRSFLGLLIGFELVSVAVLLAQMKGFSASAAFSLMHALGLIGGFILCYRTMIAEEKNRALFFLKTLPISTRTIVIGKFGANLLLNLLNMICLYLGYTLAQKAGWISLEPSLSLTNMLIGLSLQWLNSAFFLSVTLIFDSEKAVWFPFPLVWVLINIMLNFNRIKSNFHLEQVIQVFQNHQSLIVLAMLVIIYGLMGISIWSMERKKVFC